MNIPRSDIALTRTAPLRVDPSEWLGLRTGGCGEHRPDWWTER
jgi:hypothetical protein